MYDPSGHDLLRDAGAEVEVVDTMDAREVILVILKKIDMENAVIWDRSECPLSGVKRTFRHKDWTPESFQKELSIVSPPWIKYTLAP